MFRPIAASRSPYSRYVSPYHLTHIWPVVNVALTFSGRIYGETYVMPPIEASLSLSGSVSTTLSPLIETFLTLSGSAIGKLYIPLDELDITQFGVSRGVSDDIWAMSATIDGFNELNTDVLRHATFSTTDHLGVSQSIFAGILPNGSYTIREAANKTVISGYDYAWYLSRQQVQAAYQHNTAGTNPVDVITGLLGGDDWPADVTEWTELTDEEKMALWGSEQMYLLAVSDAQAIESSFYEARADAFTQFEAQKQSEFVALQTLW